MLLVILVVLRGGSHALTTPSATSSLRAMYASSSITIRDDASVSDTTLWGHTGVRTSANGSAEWVGTVALPGAVVCTGDERLIGQTLFQRLTQCSNRAGETVSSAGGGLVGNWYAYTYSPPARLSFTALESLARSQRPAGVIAVALWPTTRQCPSSSIGYSCSRSYSGDRLRYFSRIWSLDSSSTFHFSYGTVTVTAPVGVTRLSTPPLFSPGGISPYALQNVVVVERLDTRGVN